MTVSTEVDHNDYIGNGVTTSFPYTFRVFNKSDLVVTVVDLDENLTVLTPDTDYTVTGAGGYTGGNVTLMTALATGWKISISRDLPLTQETDLRNQGKFFAEVHELAFDKLTMLVQQIRSMYTSALRKPSTVANWFDAQWNYIRNVRDPKEPQDAATKIYVDSSLTDGISHTMRTPEVIPKLPPAADRRNKIPAFDDDGNPTVIPAPSGSAAEVYIELAKPTGAGLVGTTSGKTVQQELDGTLKADNNLADLEDKEEARDHLGVTEEIMKLSARIDEVDTDSSERDIALGLRIDAVNSSKRNCTAWVLFNGVNPPTIYDSYNVKSVTRIGVGRYEVNFAEPMGNKNYGIASTLGDSTLSGTVGSIVSLNTSTTGTPIRKDVDGVQIASRASGGAFDNSHYTATFYGGK